MAAGEYQLKPEVPFTPGMEAAGDIVEVDAAVKGSRSATRSSSRCGTAPIRRGGGHAGAAHAIALGPSTMRRVRRFSRRHGAGYLGLIDRGFAAGRVLLVHGAGGGVGLAAVEIGKLLGATVIAAASSEEKLEVSQEQGAPIASRALFPRAFPRRGQAHYGWSRRGCGLRSRRRTNFPGQHPLHRLGCAAAGDRFHGRHRACPHQPAADQGRERAWRPRRRGGAEEPGDR